MESLKIAFYTDTFLPAYDGVVTTILNLRRELTKRGHEVYIFAPGNAKTKQMVKGERNIYITKSMKFPKYPQYNLALAPFMTIKPLIDFKPDVIHAHTPFIMGMWALGLARIKKVPLVGSFHTLFTDRYVINEYTPKATAKLAMKYSWRYVSLYYRKCDMVIAPSDAIRKVLAKKGVSRNVSVLPSGVDVRRFNPDVNGSSVRRSLKRNSKERILLYVGRLSREKRIETLLRAASTLKNENIRFVIAGIGPAADYYKHMAHRLKLDDIVDFTGFISEEMLPKYYTASDAFCIPSTFETQGMVAVEAMASGRPVIGANSLALREVIKNGRNGELFAPGNAQSCASKIKKVINNSGSYKEARKTAQQYSLDRTTDELLKLYKQAINEVKS